MIESGKVRLVRCPKCKHILQELPDADVYACGGCGAVLQGTVSSIISAVFCFSLVRLLVAEKTVIVNEKK